MIEFKRSQNSQSVIKLNSEQTLMRTFTYICLIGATLAAKLNPSCDPETGVDQNGLACVAEEI